jgi:inorganic pyrophosphatase
MDAPAHVGCLIDVRIIGIVDAEQTQNGKTEKNSRILGAAFFVSYNKQRGKKFKITDTGSPKKRSAILRAGSKRTGKLRNDRARLLAQQGRRV